MENPTRMDDLGVLWGYPYFRNMGMYRDIWGYMMIYAYIPSKVGYFLLET